MKDAPKAGSPTDIDDYLSRVPPKQRAALQKLRKQIHAAAPRAEEYIGYQMPGFRQDGALVYFAAFKDHLSLFAASDAARKKFAKELKGHDEGTGTLHFTPEKPIPAGVVRGIVQMRVAENQARAAAKAARKKAR
jgi:uncharacterized protein YdhG (YjbR/CyaY superfamily)